MTRAENTALMLAGTNTRILVEALIHVTTGLVPQGAPFGTEKAKGIFLQGGSPARSQERRSSLFEKLASNISVDFGQRRDFLCIRPLFFLLPRSHNTSRALPHFRANSKTVVPSSEMPPLVRDPFCFSPETSAARMFLRDNKCVLGGRSRVC